jgi:hypothetical protein
MSPSNVDNSENRDCRPDNFEGENPQEPALQRGHRFLVSAAMDAVSPRNVSWTDSERR